jgi:hypothetical protein
MSASGWTVPISLFPAISVTSDRVVADRVAQRLSRSMRPFVVGLEERDLVAFLLEVLERVDDRLVLGDARDQVLALAREYISADALDREVVRLGRAARPDDLLRRRALRIASRRSRRATSTADSAFPAERVVAARGVAEVSA